MRVYHPQLQHDKARRVFWCIIIRFEFEVCPLFSIQSFYDSIMEYTKSRFASADIERHGMGAGVLPFTVDDDGHVRVLLGRERFIQAWKGSCKWSGFEGTRKADEALEDTAVREFTEESLGVVADAEHVRMVIKSGGYLMHVVLRILADRYPERYHSTYVVYIPWDETLPQRFQTMRTTIEYIDRLTQELYVKRHAVFKKNTGTTIGVIEDDDDDDDDDRSQSQSQHGGGSSGRNVYVQLQTSGVRHTASMCGEGARQLLEVRHIRNRLERTLAEHAHPCMRVVRELEVVQDVVISNDYLEKDQIRWWHMRDLCEVLKNKGHWREERFRPYFLAVLQVVVTESAQGGAMRAFAHEREQSFASRPRVPTELAEPTALEPRETCRAGAASCMIQTHPAGTAPPEMVGAPKRACVSRP